MESVYFVRRGAQDERCHQIACHRHKSLPMSNMPLREQATLDELYRDRLVRFVYVCNNNIVLTFP